VPSAIEIDAKAAAAPPAGEHAALVDLTRPPEDRHHIQDMRRRWRRRVRDPGDLTWTRALDVLVRRHALAVHGLRQQVRRQKLAVSLGGDRSPCLLRRWF